MVRVLFLLVDLWVLPEAKTIGHESSFASDTCVETSDDDERSLRAGSIEGEVFNVQEPIHHTIAPHAIAPPLDRYHKQNRSAHGKLAYVVFAGNDLGVFYNWWVFFSSCDT
jgi:hypothetical protein